MRILGWDRLLMTAALAGLLLGASCSGGEATSTGSTGGGASGGGGAAPAACPAPGSVLDPGIISASAATQAELPAAPVVSPDGVVTMVWWAPATDGTFGSGYAISNDRGATWSAPGTITGPGLGLTAWPVSAVDGKGTVHVVLESYDAAEMPTGLHVASMPMGSAVFPDAVPITDPGADIGDDGLTIAATATGKVAVAYQSASMGAVLVTSNTDGTAWVTATVDTGGGIYLLPSLCASATSDRVWLVYGRGSTKEKAVVLRWSDDGGATWPAANETLVLDAADTAKLAIRRPRCVGRGDDVYVLYSLSSDPIDVINLDNQRVDALRVARSRDGGKTIDHRADAHDPSAGAFFDGASIALEESGALDVAYVALAAAHDPAAVVRRTRSTDAGQTFCGSLAVQQPLDASGQLPGTGLAWQGGDVFLSHGEIQAGAVHTAIHRARVP